MTELEPRHHRKTLGGHPITGRTLYGWDPGCSCGWSTKSNDDKRNAAWVWRNEHFNKVDTRARLLIAGKHLTPTQFGRVVTQVAARGINWSGCSKGQVIEGVETLLRSDRFGFSRIEEQPFNIEELEEVLRSTLRQGSRLKGE